MHSRAELFETHARRLADRSRIATWERAISGAVKPGDVVVDLRGGFGLTALLACRAGARRVYAIEPDEIAELTRMVLADNGVADRVEVIRAPSWQVVLPELADVMVADVLHASFDIATLALLSDARRRLVKPGGRTLPNRLQILAAPIDAPRQHSTRVAFWDNLYGFDYSSLRAVAAGEVGSAWLSPGDLAAEPRALLEADLSQPEDVPVRGSATFEFNRPAQVHAIAAWLRVDLGDAGWISSEPAHPNASHSQQLFPLGEALSIDPSEVMTVELSADTSRLAAKWTVSTHPRGESTLRLIQTSSSGAASASNESPESRRLAFLRASIGVLEALEAGQQTVQRLTDDITSKNSSLFPTRRAAQEFVVDLLLRYATSNPGDPHV